jgi:hypothetical protein
MKFAKICATIVLISGCSVLTAPEPAYLTAQRLPDFEVRAYPPILLAEVTVPGPADAAGGQGFVILADYIFGKNRGASKLAMTAPVIQMPVASAPEAVPSRLTMGAPVTQSAADGGFVVQFVMPAGSTLGGLPVPVDARIRLREQAARKVAVIRYSGRWSQSNYQEHLDRLRSALAQAALVPRGEPVLARYNPPFMPFFLRRNEIWLELP